MQKWTHSAKDIVHLLIVLVERVPPGTQAILSGLLAKLRAWCAVHLDPSQMENGLCFPFFLL